MTFEWDPLKAEENLVKHGIPFEYATRVFEDPNRIEREDTGELYDEIRYQIIGLVEGILYLTKSDQEFDETYVKNQKQWF